MKYGYSAASVLCLIAYLTVLIDRPGLASIVLCTAASIAFFTYLEPKK